MSTLDPRAQSDLDQANKAVTDNLPSLLYQLYTRFKKEGFNDLQAFQLCQTYLASLMSSVRGN